MILPSLYICSKTLHISHELFSHWMILILMMSPLGGGGGHSEANTGTDKLRECDGQNLIRLYARIKHPNSDAEKEGSMYVRKPDDGE